MSNISVGEIVQKYLKDNGYDGLCNDECGCLIDDLIPCCEISQNCEAGYRHIKNCGNDDCEKYCERENGFCIQTEPPKVD